MFDFQPGQIYNRRRDIHGKFRGQQQGGISTPRDFPVVFAFTGSVGTQHGYEDGWSDDGVFNYFGEGQKGDMAFSGGNRAIRDHVADRKELLLFQKVRHDGSVRYLGNFTCIGFEYVEAPDTNKELRQAIVFQLVPTEDFSSDLDPQMVDHKSFDDLRKAAYGANDNHDPVRSKEVKVKAFKRSATVRSYALARAKGICEACDKPAPFNTPTGAPYLEVHHILRLTDGGPDRPDRVAAICPNCHRAAHHSADKRVINTKLLERVKEAESKLSE